MDKEHNHQATIAADRSAPKIEYIIPSLELSSRCFEVDG